MLNVRLILLFFLIALASVQMVRDENRHYETKKPFQISNQSFIASGFYWAKYSIGESIPPHSVKAGRTAGGYDIYVGLGEYGGTTMPARIIPGLKQADVPFNGHAKIISNYKILVERRLIWVNNTGRNIPPSALPVGRMYTGEKFYIGRKKMKGNAVSVGKVYPQHGVVYFPFGGKEVQSRKYEILVYQG